MGEKAPSPATSPDLPRLMISGTRQPVSYINRAKRLLGEHGRLELCALGNALAPLVTVAEILKGARLAVEERIETAFETVTVGARQRQKAKLVVILRKSPHYNNVIARERHERERSDAGALPVPSRSTPAPEEEPLTDGSIKGKARLEDGPLPDNLLDDSQFEDGPLEDGPLEGGLVEGGLVEDGPTKGPVGLLAEGPLEDGPLEAEPVKGRMAALHLSDGPVAPAKDSRGVAGGRDDKGRTIRPPRGRARGMSR